MLNENPKFVKSINRGDNVYYQYYYKGWFYTFPLNMVELKDKGILNISEEVNKFKENIDSMLIEMNKLNYIQMRFTDYGI